MIISGKLNDWHGMDEKSGPQNAKDKRLAQALKLKTLHFTFSDPRSH